MIGFQLDGISRVVKDAEKACKTSGGGIRKAADRGWYVAEKRAKKQWGALFGLTG